MEDNQAELKTPPRKGIYLLPNLLTTGAMFAGFYAVVAAMQGKFEAAAVAVFVAMILDGLDGRVARMTNTQSEFGAQYDSMADLISFGVAPGLVMYQWALVHLQSSGAAWGKAGWLAAFVYVACAALRLARFNVQIGKVDKRFFVGLPSPASAALMVGMVWVFHDLDVTGRNVQIPALFLTLAAGLLMVSNVSFYSFKDFDLRNRVPFVAVLVVLLVFALTTIDPPKVLFGVFLLYALSGPVLWAWRRWRRFQRRKKDMDA
ncbi:MAG TPA: CDP-diacylglycerol--serine O-phosphatidyltransferase [Candidatus Thiothrix moscowensis]|uniref:CDP-diacylglycerol--serine O-phosphatidyltransferase n=1 Tax=unclassified Thiothrix TaxID=2636184 RepID=UPI001A361D2E|nr:MULTISPECIES: CDP-diacylglycerol--serine O-phosphatidyltransferase [unclassified Thiothrix]MBJ6609953.1 CDP-diacylglycerol--serine O-phosphatidyltransferase [Candidatus Thiothrix moscowensis]HRJ52858.1 CDP-diacylglycerol--serine O-phosphatidyltransferase [Candidatus Thiothrix moscowensis]HRJ93408.1 CDP-diacylglycerol--serine O-phosphatidyltransferase [Candidatus Thiothrix moscowensis]